MPIEPSDLSAGRPAFGGTLRQLLRATPRLAPERAAVLLAGIARAAAAWHARGTAHGALTPERVLVGAGDAVTLAAPPRPDGSPAPWPTYLAPEQIDGRTGDVRSDVYAFGLLGWEMLAGQQPWEGESLYGVVVKQREQDLPRLSTLRPGLPRAVLGAIEGCLHKAPGDRWQSAAEFLATLAPALPAPPGPAPDAPREPAAAARAPLTPPGPVAGVVARTAAAGAVPGLGAEPRGPEDAYRTRRAAGPDAGPTSEGAGGDEDDAPRGEPREGRRVERPRRRGRWLATAVLLVALVGAAGAAVVVVRGRSAARETRTWLDSLSATGVPAGNTGAAAATTTTDNTTAVPVRRSGGPRREQTPVEEAPDDTAADVVEVEALEETPVLQPTPPLVPPRTGRAARPTVPRPDTLTPDSLARR